LPYQASYVRLLKDGGLAERKAKAYRRLSCCDLCAHACQADRLRGRTGICRAGQSVTVADYGPHFGEEDVLVGQGGSGTIFFTGCNLQCVFCQNWEISQLREGETVSVETLAGMMLELEEKGCHNINLVTPTPYLPPILAALEIAATRGLNLPLVYNCGGYESLAALELLDGVIDIYLPDVKFGDDAAGLKLAGAPDYFAAVKSSLKEMHRQVGDLQLDERGIACRGLIVRHLVLPGGLAGTDEIVRFIAAAISPDTYINLMNQYYPAYRAKDYPRLHRGLSAREYGAALQIAREAGLHHFA
jgi:putative pyruvate formate lyase activating enzyme